MNHYTFLLEDDERDCEFAKSKLIPRSGLLGLLKLKRKVIEQCEYRATHGEVWGNDTAHYCDQHISPSYEEE